MELDILKTNTTWNDASASINNNFAKVKTALEQGGGSGADLTEVNKKIAALTEETERLEADKQDVLVSGSNIKTINGQSILGVGNIAIEGGGGGGNTKIYTVYVQDSEQALESWKIEKNAQAVAAVQAKEDAIYVLEDSGGTRFVGGGGAFGTGAIFSAYIISSTAGDFATIEVHAALLKPNGEILEGGYLSYNLTVPTEEQVEQMIADSIGSGGGSITLDTEMSDTSTNAVQNKVIKKYVDAHANEPELRPLYVPNLNAGSTLTDSQMAYNEETCQKMLNGAAIAVVSDGTAASYSENIVDLSMYGMLGYIVSFRGLGGFYISGGDVALTLPDVSTSVTITTDVESYDTLSLIMALATSNMGMLPTFYFLLEDATNNMFIIDDVTAIGAGFILTTRFEHGTNTYQLICALDAEGGNALELRPIPYKLTFGGNEAYQENFHWIASRDFVGDIIPRLVHYQDRIEYVPVAIENYIAEMGKRTKFTIYRNGAFETWEMNSAGQTQLIQ